MKNFNINSLIFSSSCTVYGNAQYLPIDENHSIGSCLSPYARTKFMIEEILKDEQRANPVSESDWVTELFAFFRYST